MTYQMNVLTMITNTMSCICKLTIFILFLILPIYSYAECNHVIVDRDPRFACVTVINKYHKSLAITGYPGFSLDPGSSEETMLLMGFIDSVRITPNPYSPYENEKQLGCKFSISQAREKQITITYNNGSYDVNPIEFKNNCIFKIPNTI